MDTASRRGSRRAGRRLGAIALTAGWLAALAPAPASAFWNQPVGGPSPLNQSTAQDANSLSLAAIGGVPHVAWSELEGTSVEIRVARLNPATGTWEQPWVGVSATSGGINQSTARSGFEPSLADVGGVPHVAWAEFDGTNQEIRVAKLDVGTNTWGEPWAGVTATSGGINQSTSQRADNPSLASIGGVPHVAFEELDGTNSELRVARLNGSTWGQPWLGVSSTSGGINSSTARNAEEPSLTAIGGVPFVAWHEFDGTNAEIRIARVDNLTPDWEQPWAGVSATYGGVNQSATLDGVHPSLALIGGILHVAWLEDDGTNVEVRVARVTANAWGQPWSGVTATSGGINQSTIQATDGPSLASVGGKPHVSWTERDAANFEVRVSRLNSGGVSTWQQLVGGVSPINQSSSGEAAEPSLASMGGVPHVGWTEFDTTNFELRVSRLEPEFTSQAAAPADTTATLTVDVHTYGIPYPIGFRYGTALENQTTTETAPAGSENVTIARQAGGLSPATTYQFRPFATAGAPAPRVLGPIGFFTTAPAGAQTPAPAPPAPGTPGGSEGATPLGPAAIVLSGYRVSPSVFRAASRGASIARRRPTGTRVSYTLSASATVRFRVQRAAAGRRVGGRCRRPARGNRGRPRCVRHVTLPGSFTHEGRAGRNRFTFTGRLRGGKLRPGAFRLQARTPDGDGSPAARAFRIVRR